jgi:hypothetical protein
MRRRTLLCLCSDFWPLKTWLQSTTILTCLIWPLTISSYFKRMKSKLKGRRFQDVTEIQEQSPTVLHAIPKSQFQLCFQQ